MAYYPINSITKSFTLDFLLEERLDIAVYGGSYNSSVWLSDPSAMLSAINEKLDEISDLEFSAIEVVQIKNDQDAMIITLKNARYQDRKYLNIADLNSLRGLIATKLATVANFTFSSVEGVSSQLGGEMNFT